MRAKNIFKNVLKIGLILAAGLISLSLVFAQSTQQIEQNPGTCGNPTGSVTVNAFFDRNANGVRDLNSNEYGLAGFVYTLDGTSQQLVGSTDNNGQFVFFNVPVGNHTITQAPIAGWAPTTTNPFVINVRNGSNQVFVGNRTAAKNPPWNNVEQESLFNAQEIPQRQIPSNIQPQSLEGQTGFKEEQSERNQEQQIQRTSQMPSQQNSS
ncbi:MAG: hypothetical protein M1355_00635, partial [Patescibacteria group bacterium]|nr:hypothetical protein [Patescibacteria group bacterium]